MNSMDKGGDMGGPAANNSSDFVGISTRLHAPKVNASSGSQVVQVRTDQFAPVTDVCFLAPLLIVNFQNVGGSVLRIYRQMGRGR